LIRKEAIEDFEAENADLAKQKLTAFCYKRAMDALNEAEVVLDKMTDHTVEL